MNAHLNDKLPWSSLVKNYYRNYTESLVLPMCKCKKIHIINKSNEIKIRNKKYINEEQICRNINCKEISEETFCKNKIKVKKWEIDAINANYSYYKKTYDKRMNALHFIKKYNNVLNEFADNYIKKINKIREEQSKQNIKQTREEIDIHFIKRIKEYFLLDDAAKPHYYCDDSVHCYGSYGSASDYEYVYALISSGDDNDVILLLDEIDNGLYIGNIVREWGTQCFGRYARYIVSQLNELYIMINMIIASGNFTNKEVWKKCTRFKYMLKIHRDFHDIIPRWKNEHFNQDTMQKFKDIENNDVTFFDCIKIEKLDELLEKIFRYNYIWLALYKYTSDEVLSDETYNIFLNLRDLGYDSDDFKNEDILDESASSNL